MDLQLTEAPAEGDLLRRGDALLAEHQHMVVQVRPVDTAEVLGGQGQPEVEAEHLGAERGIEARICRERRRALAPEGKRTSLTPTQARTRQARDTAQGGMDSVRRADWSAGTREPLI